MPKLSWAILPLTIACWMHGWELYRESLVPLYGSVEEQQLWNPPPPDHPWITPPTHASDLKVMGSEPDNIFYFMQVSDLHVSTYKPKYLERLRIFLNTTLPTVKPSFVFATGDLTDAKGKAKFTDSKQVRVEWEDYNRAIRESGVLDRPNFWWDQRGNHDCFNVPNWSSKQNYYRNLSSVKEENYTFHFKTSFGSYTFLGIDACPTSGPSRPFNFFAYFDRDDMDFLQSRLARYPSSNHTFLLSHYPLAMTITGLTTDGLPFESLSRNISVMLCGHLHKLEGLGELLHVHHPSNMLELELADMKANGGYRILAIDHDLVSFVDSSVLPDPLIPGNKATTSNPLPVVLITNPKDARYIISHHDPTDRIAASTHIRILAFSALEIQKVTVEVDGVAFKEEAKFTGNEDIPMWTVRWNPSLYSDGKPHSIVVTATDGEGKSGAHSIIFRTDSITEPMEWGFGRMIMTPKYQYWSKVFFLLGYFTVMFLLIIPKIASMYLHKTRRYHRWRIQYSAFLVKLDKSEIIQLPDGWLARFTKIQMLRLRLIYRDFRYFVSASIFRMVTLASLPTTYYPLLIYGLYIVVGPFFVGELIPSARTPPSTGMFEGLGQFYLYGVYIQEHWVPIPDTWFFGMFEIAYLFGPLVIYLSFCITPPEQLYSQTARTEDLKPSGSVFIFPPRHNRRKYPLHRRLTIRMAVALISFYQLVNVYYIGLYYGPLAVLFSPGKTWFVLWACYALYKHRWSAIGHEIDLL
eukprot:Partr_v1_DN28229_c1_g1_i1_m76306 putative transmembrane protein 62